MSSLRSFAVIAATAAAIGCGPNAVFRLSSDDNNPAKLEAALAIRQVATTIRPANGLGKPLVFAVVSGTPRTLIAYDVEAAAPLWSIQADVQSRVVVAGDVLVVREGAAVVVRTVATGAERAKLAIDGELVGATTDGERVFLVTQTGTATKPLWVLAAYSPDGSPLWRNESAGALGAPAAQGGLVLSPFLKQWLSIIDARTGAQLTRIRGIDEEISVLRVTSDAAFFGSKKGAIRLDAAAAAGTRAGTTYGTVTLPAQLAAADFGVDAFDPVQLGYTAFDRKRVLWRAQPTTSGPMTFQDDLIGVHVFRFVFGLTPAGEFRWAYSQPRVPLVASAHAGPVLAALSRDGDLVALDPVTGAVRANLHIDVAGPVLGATLDCDGWAPTSDAPAPSTVAALATIARDRDASFEDIKQYAVSIFASLQGADVTRDLLAIVVDPRTPTKLHDQVAALLIARRDPAGLPALLGALAVHPDFITGAQPVGTVEVAQAIAALGTVQLDPAAAAQAVTVIGDLAFDPALAPAPRLELVRALVAIGHGSERGRLRQALVLSRADPAFAAETDLVTVMAAAVAAGGPEDRELVRWLADDARTAPAVAAAARAALAP
ncbi:MAG: PQQ-binding-like beta-propeller repeat protein [Kofleriaceae bacterium]